MTELLGSLLALPSEPPPRKPVAVRDAVRGDFEDDPLIGISRCSEDCGAVVLPPSLDLAHEHGEPWSGKGADRAPGASPAYLLDVG